MEWSIKPSLTEKMVDILQYVAEKEKITTNNIVVHFLKNLIRQSQLANQASIVPPDNDDCIDSQGNTKRAAKLKVESCGFNIVPTKDGL